MRVLDNASASRSIRNLLAPVAVGAACLTIAACGSSNSNSSGSGGSNSGSNSSHQANSGGSATVSTAKVSGYGTVLATSSGSALYLLTADPSGGSKCTGACAKQWPPLIVSGKPSAGSGVNASMLSSFKRSDGTEQVLYNGHALYTHPGMSATAVAGTAANGGIWYLISPSGKAITKTTGSGY